MRRKPFPLAVACLFLTLTASAQSLFNVVEADTKAFFAGNRLQTNLVFDNRSEEFQAKIKLDVLDTDDRVIASSETFQTIKSGRQAFAASLDFARAQDEKSLLWNRLKYTITNADETAASGVVSLSEIMPEIFELRVSGAENVYAGMNYRVRVRAFHPVKNLPTANVKIGGEVKLEIEGAAEKLILTAGARTDRDGYAVLNFKIPEAAKIDGGGAVKITGEKNGVRRETEQDLDGADEHGYVYLNTDKPIYQPGQKFYARGLFTTENNFTPFKIVADRAVDFIVEDEDETILYRETATTSRFGVASISWKIPDDAKLGTYRIVVKDAGEEIGAGSFKISRYDLPEFTVAAKADKSYYLPADETAEITVSAEYLFGKPVEKGTVKVVRETERNWNYAKQKYEIGEENAVAGETDADGKFVARVDLKQPLADLKAEDYSRFEDLHFGAYFTDASSNRTEQRRFDVRISKDAMHVYLVGVDSYGDHNRNLPVRFYVSTFYADGAPASCDVLIEGKYEDEAEAKILTRVKTNSLGAGWVEFAAPKRADGNYEHDFQLKARASDAQKRTGGEEEKIDVDADRSEVQIRTTKAVYRGGEAIDAEIISSEPNADVFVDVVKDWSPLYSTVARLKNGRATVSIPYSRNFKGNLTVAAYIDEDAQASRGIVYPHPTNLTVDARQTKTVYRPNEEARVDFTVKAPDKTSGALTALGVVVFDKAIEERARTEAEFGGGDAVNQLGDWYRLLDNDFNRIDVSKPISKDLQLKAELALAGQTYYPRFFGSDYYGADLKKTFANYFERQFKPIQAALESRYATDFEHPTDAATLQTILLKSSIDFANLKDPWATPYAAEVKTERDEDAIYIRSAGANKTFGDKDDVVLLALKFKYFTPVGKAIDKAVEDFHERTGSFVRDYAALRGELEKQNVDLDSLKDRFNRPYQIAFGVSEKFHTIEFKSLGANGKAGKTYDGDDFSVWTSRANYFADAEAKIQAILGNYANAEKTFPADENQFRRILKNGGVDFDALRDGWNRPLRLEFAVSSRYVNRVKTEVVGKYGDAGKSVEKMIVLPVTQQLATVRLKSAGADGKPETSDDFDLATFSGVVGEQSKTDAKAVEVETGTVFSGGSGAVRGTITDPNGAVIPNAKLTATNEKTSAVFTAASNEDGFYILANLPSGQYTVRAEAAGFAASVIENVPVVSTTVSELNVEMLVGAANQTVNVMSAEAATETTQNQLSVSYENQKFTLNVHQENATPRLREYFPETLLWQPELITDKNGKARLKFKLADNLTTWKLYAVGSDADGRVGVVEREIKTFQPFFVSLEPPKNLTVGDEIGLPVSIRNYTESAQKVAVSMARGDWFSFLNDANQTIDVLPNKTENAVFDFRADSATKEGKQRVTATAATDADAIEKTVAVHPNGREIVNTQSEIFRDAARFDVDFPANALPKTREARVKIYPNLLAHVAESVEGLLQRPYGCGEQIISSTYPNLMILKAAKNAKYAVAPKLKTQAEKFLRQGIERLLVYQKADGGFSVWTQDAADAALTAYAIRFLTDARDFTDVDENVISRAQKWLAAQQRADGSWSKSYSWERAEDKNRTKILTTYIARILAATERDKKEKSKDAQNALQKSFDYLKTRNAEIDEPFALASFALALFDAGDAESARAITEKLETLAIAEDGGAYWNLETNTPFCGWGSAGRIETTALVVEALIRANAERGRRNAESKTKDLISKGALFLLKNKDRYGVWHSTQATVNVLDALLAVVGDGEDETAANRTAEIFVNNRKVKEINLPAANILAAPFDVDLSDVLSTNKNSVEIKIGGNRSAATAQMVSNYYVAWRDFAADGRDVNQARRLRLAYDCDKKAAAVMQEINCAVQIERVGFRGYGMLLAEIGLPPGADVDRASLERAKAEDWSFSRYDVLPDRIVVYMWARAGGTRINFKFKPRYALNAQSAASIVYDYYNPEAQATLAPLKFSVK